MPKKRERSAVEDEELLTKGPWTPVEDEVLTEYVQEHGEGNWNRVRLHTGIPRSGKSCRLRWLNHLRPNLKKGSFSYEEEKLVLELHARLGNKWSLIAAQLPGRTDNDIKNFWNTRAKRHEGAGWPLYFPGLPSAGRAPIHGRPTSLPAQNPNLRAGNVPVPPSSVQPNGNAALASVQEATPFRSSLISDRPPFIQYASQSREMIATPGFLPRHNADFEADRHRPSGTHHLPSFGPVFETTMPELPSGQHLQTGQGSQGEPSFLPLHQIVDTRQHPHPLAAENALLQNIGPMPHALQSSKATEGYSDPRCYEIRTESRSAWPAQAPDSGESSLGLNFNPEAPHIDETRPDALLGQCWFFA